MSEMVLEEKPQEETKKSSKKGNKAEENLPKFAILYFGDTMGKITIMNYLEGRVAGNEKHIDPAKQLVIFNVTTKSDAENNKVSKGLEHLISELGTPNEIRDIQSSFKNHSDAYLHSFNDKGFIGKVIETMGDEIRFLVFTGDNSAYTGLAGCFNVAAMETNTDAINAERKKSEKHPIRLIYENAQKDLFNELQRYFEYIRTLFNLQKDSVANDLLNGNMEIDLNDMADEKLKRIAFNYIEARNSTDSVLPLQIKSVLDNDPNKTFYVRQYKE